MSNSFYKLNARSIKKVLDNSFIVSKDRFSNVLVDDVCSEIKYFISNENRLSDEWEQGFIASKKNAINKTFIHLDDIQSAFSSLSEGKMVQIKKGYLIFFKGHTTNLSKEKLLISEDFIFALMDTMYHYFYQTLMQEYKQDMKLQYRKAYSLLSLSIMDNNDVKTIRTTEGLINDKAMKDRVLICGHQLSYRKGDEKYLFFKFLTLQSRGQRYRPVQQSALKGMARRIINNDKYVINKIKTIPNYFIKVSKYSFKDIV